MSEPSKAVKSIIWLLENDPDGWELIMYKRIQHKGTTICIDWSSNLFGSLFNINTGGVSEWIPFYGADRRALARAVFKHERDTKNTRVNKKLTPVVQKVVEWALANHLKSPVDE